VSLPVLATAAAAFVLGLYGGVLLLGTGGGGATADSPSAQAAAQLASPVAEATPSPTPQVYSAGSYTFSNVEVVNDGLGDFAIRADVTNNGGPCAVVMFTASIFDAGTVVGTVTGTVQAFESGETAAITMNGLSDFATAWDELAFQVDAES